MYTSNILLYLHVITLWYICLCVQLYSNGTVNGRVTVKQYPPDNQFQTVNSGERNVPPNATTTNEVIVPQVLLACQVAKRMRIFH